MDDLPHDQDALPPVLRHPLVQCAVLTFWAVLGLLAIAEWVTR